MVTQLVAFPAISNFDVHVQHGDDAVQDSLAAIIYKSEFRVCYNPEVVCFDYFLEDDFVIVLDGANARRF